MKNLNNPHKQGTGITERSLKQSFIGDVYVRAVPDERTPFDGRALEAEVWALRVLMEAVDVPPDVLDEQLWEFAREAACELARKIRKGGSAFRPYEHAEWYAAEVLARAGRVRREIAARRSGEAAADAFSLGLLVREAEMKFQFEPKVLAHERSRAGGAKGGQRPKGIAALRSFLNSRIKKNPARGAGDLWRSFPDDEVDAVRVGNAKLFIEFDRLCVIERQGKNWERVADVSFRTFRNYVTATKKALAR